ncbi:uncharacterized protein LOC133527908 [Cydia pomonella]|uniref:uncharacterized protein LOC133527908 n=1 Tax=Cydia pomonella TaxID=82600 RepID=UPI002ADDDD98|nr:uncharacterized protein LOC133527908 [Cydia pomonella]
MTASARTSSTSAGPAQRAAPALAAAGGAAGSARSAAVTSSRHALSGKRAMSLTRAHSDVQYNAPRNNNSSFARNSRTMSVHATTAVDYLTKIKCAYCKDNSHPLYKCEKFNTLTLKERKHFVEQNKLCTNCLFIGHDAKDCKSRHTCRVCTQRHHSSLHEDAPSPNVLLTTESSSSPELRSVAETYTPTPLHGATEHPSSKNCTVLLTTALVNLRPLNQGPYSPRSVRALVDQGAQTTLISESCVQRLGLPRYSAQTSTTLTGIGGEVQPRGYVLCEVTPHNKPEPKLHIEALILPNLTSYTANIPKSIGDIQKFPHLQNLDLADPELRSTRPVELLLGSDYLDSILLLDNIKGSPGTPVAINSIFGYMLGGRISYDSMKRLSVNLSTCQLDMKLQKFWELESIPEHPHLTKEELRCESIFVDTHRRDANGKYTVSLPFKENAPPLGDSRAIALSRLTKLEARLSRDPALRENYNKCIQEYLDLGHMEPVTDSASPGTPPYYLPHHIVVKGSASTTKYRIVYDASCKTTSGRSLNDNLLTGQKLHQDISETLLKYRLHKIVFTADLKMMYRYIGLCKEHRDFHRILWRFSPHDPVKEYRMCSVTFGVASAPFLALRTLRQLAIDEAANFPLASQVLRNEVFVDDVVTGANTVEDALTLQHQLLSICKAGTFELRKWTSNSAEFLSHLNDDASNHDDALILSALDTDTSVKVLGLKWNPKSDIFTYQTDGVANSRKCTKRIMLAEIAKIYDPLGFLSPVTVFVKHLIQLLWVSGSGWDSASPQGICDLWFRFIDELPLLQDIALPRHVLPSTHQVSLHGFSDASEKAYAACVYIRVVDSNGAISTHLLIGKTKIAPLKRLTIPRLELCAAHLLSKLVKKVLTAYSSRLSFDQVYAWSDSTITLAWLRSSPDKWRTYVSNRIAETTSNVPASQWHHVQSADNPADPASRGVLPSQLNHQLWFTGPAWLSKNESEWPKTNVVCHTDEERRKHVLVTQTKEPNNLEFIERFSSLPRMLRVISYMLRIINKCRKANSPTTKHITVPETKQALSRIISLVQSDYFSEDISRLKDDDRCTKRLQKLKPFLDDAGLLRVGGRINRANVPNDPTDPLPLTPGHFLIGEPLTSLPEFDLSNDNPNRLARWQVIQQAVQHFWKRWSVEYLHQLQPRGKWFHDNTNTPLREGSVVVLIDNTLPPLQWRLARVHQLHPGADGITRVVTVRIGSTLTKRPVLKVCPLPVE